MFKNSYQSGFLSILYSIGSKPLQIWDKTGAPTRIRARARALLRACARTSRPCPGPRASAPPPPPPPRPVQNGHIKRLTDADIQSSVLEIMSSNVLTTYITTPADPAQTLGIKV
jgi:hypothetical protein